MAATYFLSEQWKEKHKTSWEKLITVSRPIANRVNAFSAQIKGYHFQVKHQISLAYVTLTVKKDKPLDPVAKDDNYNTDLEKGEFIRGVARNEPLFNS